VPAVNSALPQIPIANPNKACTFVLKESILLYDSGKLKLDRIRKNGPKKRQLPCFCWMSVAPSRSGKHCINPANSYN